MADVLLHHLLLVRQRERPWHQRLFYADDDLSGEGIEHLRRSAAFQVELLSQHRSSEQIVASRPASKRPSDKEFEDSSTLPPAPGSFQEKEVRLHQRETLQVADCKTCRGKGILRCEDCFGTGILCNTCDGDGRVLCHTCLGEGMVVQWVVLVQQWTVEQRGATVLPRDDLPLLGETVESWFQEVGGELLPDLEPETLRQHLDVVPDAGLLLRVKATQDALLKKSQSSKEPFLHHSFRVRAVPIGYALQRSGLTAQESWLVGHGPQAQLLLPRKKQLDPIKGAGWLGLGSGGAMAALSVMPVLPVPDPLLLAGGALAGMATLAGGYRTFGPRRPLPILISANAGGRATGWLSVLAYVGSYTRRLRVLDRDYGERLALLRGGESPRNQSQSLTVELENGRRARLLEVDGLWDRAPEVIELIERVADGFLIFEPSAGQAFPLAERLRAIGGGRGETPLHIVPLDSGEDLPPGPALPGDPLPVDAIRQHFVTSFDRSIDWEALFDHLFAPVERLLEATTNPRNNPS